jgi:GalNAc-alpha-(1->4)-GalNAc-alpha-(1->3)-diNAcBac-PP-undecaprenol alpha-1,4-N-acetyl-D-galactosaminyltransferase
MRITFVIYSLCAGGAERVMSRMANYWAGKGWPITILTLKDGSEPPFYELHPAVSYCPLGIAENSGNLVKAIYNNLRRMYVLRHAIKNSQPEIVISFMDQTNILTLQSTLGLNVPIVVSEHIDPYNGNCGWIWNQLRQLLYPRAARVIVLTERALSYFSERVRPHCQVIPNPVAIPGIGHEFNGRDGASPAKIILAMGRLDRQKGFDSLLEAFSRIAPAWPEWSLEIWGEGPERPALERLIAQKELVGRVRLPGSTRQPFEKMQHAGLFVMSSRYEGFPNVLGEAMACCLPVISFDCPTGPREIIRDGIDGILVPPGNISALTGAMDRLLANEVERKRLAQNASAVLERFALEKIMDIWEEMLQEVTQPVNKQ